MPPNITQPSLLPSCAALESKYCALLEERLSWRNLVSYVGNRTEPVLRWFRENFNSELARHAGFGLTKEDFILNTFSVSGAALIYAAQHESITDKFIQKYARNK